MIEVTEVSGIGQWVEKPHGEKGEDRVYEVPGTEKAFLVRRPKTLEVRCDEKLAKMLREKYETVMESRYFGRGGIEIVPSEQLTDDEVADLVRLSYNLSGGHDAEQEL